MHVEICAPADAINSGELHAGGNGGTAQSRAWAQSEPGPVRSQSMTAAPTAKPQQPTVKPAPLLCSPLEGFSLADMPALVANPYDPPPPESDDPHSGVDLADAQNPGRIALAGRVVQAALAGRVAAVTNNRFPFGSAVIIETPLSSLPAGWAAALDLPPLREQALKPISLSCPALAFPAGADNAQPSLYVLYAHLQDAPALAPGEAVSCGQAVGAVGQSGNALNPHLHFEVRLGPGGARLGPFAHYDASATLAEMASYCTWTVSGFFQLLDPLALLAQHP